MISISLLDFYVTNKEIIHKTNSYFLDIWLPSWNFSLSYLTRGLWETLLT